jgi:hypothetical protein
LGEIDGVEESRWRSPVGLACTTRHRRASSPRTNVVAIESLPSLHIWSWRATQAADAQRRVHAASSLPIAGGSVIQPDGWRSSDRLRADRRTLAQLIAAGARRFAARRRGGDRSGFVFEPQYHPAPGGPQADKKKGRALADAPRTARTAEAITHRRLRAHLTGAGDPPRRHRRRA